MISIIIPIYKEKSLYSVINTLRKKIEKKFNNFEIILVNNGSDSDTLNESKKISSDFKFIKNYILKDPNYGKALKVGLKKSTKPISIILEFDFLNYKFLIKSIKKINFKKASLVLGSKTHQKSKDKRGILRVLMTYVFNKLLFLVLNVRASDTHGLKAITKDLRKKILKNCKSSNHAYQTEIVLVAEKLKFKIEEIPVEISESRPTKLNVFFRVLTYLLIIKELYFLKKNYK